MADKFLKWLTLVCIFFILGALATVVFKSISPSLFSPQVNISIKDYSSQSSNHPDQLPLFDTTDFINCLKNKFNFKATFTQAFIQKSVSECEQKIKILNVKQMEQVQTSITNEISKTLINYGLKKPIEVEAQMFDSSTLIGVVAIVFTLIAMVTGVLSLRINETYQDFKKRYDSSVSDVENLNTTNQQLQIIQLKLERLIEEIRNEIVSSAGIKNSISIGVTSLLIQMKMADSDRLKKLFNNLNSYLVKPNLPFQKFEEYLSDLIEFRQQMNTINKDKKTEEEMKVISDTLNGFIAELKSRESKLKLSESLKNEPIS